MAKIKVYNPTNHTLNVMIQGYEYEAAPESYACRVGKPDRTDIPEDHASHWKNRIHQFIELQVEEDGKAEEVVVTEKKEEKEEEEEGIVSKVKKAVKKAE